MPCIDSPPVRREISDYIDYVRGYLFRRGPNNGFKPISFQQFVAEEYEDGCDSYDRHMAFECRQGNFV